MKEKDSSNSGNSLPAIKIEVTSSLGEKAIDTAKEFLGKLILAPLEEMGLLIKDQIAFVRFKNQVRMLNKAQLYCQKHNITPRAIPFKLLVPLIEHSSLEEDELLQDKWSILLGNLIDSEQNIESNVFPYILSQISKNEYLFLDKYYYSDVETKKKAKEDLEYRKVNKEGLLKIKIEEKGLIDEQIQTLLIDPKKNSVQIRHLEDKRREVEYHILGFDIFDYSLKARIKGPAKVKESEIREFELFNLIRLGLVKKDQYVYANSSDINIPSRSWDEYDDQKVTVEIDVDSEIEYVITELGKLFIIACSEKHNY